MQDWYWLNEDSVAFLNEGYLLPGVTPIARIEQIARRAEEYLGIPGYADKFIANMAKGWYSLSSPEWSNYALDRGLAVSCFGGYAADDTEEILFSHAEQGMLSKLGGGTSMYFGHVRHRGAEIKDNGTSNGVVPFVGMFERMTDVISQGSTRRGYMAAYLDANHPDIEEFLRIGEDGSDIQAIMTGVCLSDEWLASMEAGDKGKRRIWAEILRQRSEKGYPYLFFSDNVNKAKPECYANDTIYASNLC